MQMPEFLCHKVRATLAAMASCICSGTSIATEAHVQPLLVVVGKSVNYRQQADRRLIRLNYHFFAEIFLPAGLQGAGQLIDPRGHVMSFQPEDGILSIPADRDFNSLVDLNAYSPDGTYTVQFDAPSVLSVHGAIPLHAAEEAFADPAQLTLLQNGQTVAPAQVAVGNSLTVVWSPFRKGRSDPNRITDDLIFVHVADCRGQLIARTPAPFADPPALTYRAPSYTIAPDTFAAGATYQISVEHARVETERLAAAGVPAVALATYPATTYLDFHTQGAESPTCPDKPYRMDNGQSDRQPAPVSRAAASASDTGDGGASGSVTGQATFLYYDDLAAPRRFYSEILGFPPYFETEWVILFHPTSGATIGLVKEPNTAITPALRRSVVMVSIITDDVASWNRKLEHDPRIHIVKKLYDHPQVPIRAFEVEDPGGYPIEFFQWLTR